ncbi:MAG: HAD hydrolase family protein [Bacteroidales bacterium]|nr:HAD hydrolase family protein [Bacteroidales bacterium]
MKNLTDKLQKINTFIFDFDGVLSDGKVYTMADGEQVRATNVKDGYALHYALNKGYNIAVISGGYAESMRHRFKAFHGMEIFLQVGDKIERFNQYLADHNLTAEQVLVMGDDIPDYPMLKLAGIKCCPQDASEEIKNIVDYISPRNGGNGAVRDVIEQVMKAQGKWMNEDAFIW